MTLEAKINELQALANAVPYDKLNEIGTIVDQLFDALDKLISHDDPVFLLFKEMDLMVQSGYSAVNRVEATLKNAASYHAGQSSGAGSVQNSASVSEPP
ncbi:hypothetical protein NQK81_08965 [Amycolatopsis roodepoortensis]|uniref:hypothetical protein n=1 Tax=Amycolatopsis roodepoortensis TaxID=700274 RepID=UPI00214C76B2|nr:hypothetical protein [Amycolatopsis roodepoortensis]UUV33566.1 hypothetical protein NQK81_08965 [Amycolatopsis roodepoortensis]